MPKPKSMRVQVPGWEGSIGPFRPQYGEPHVYARDVWSGAGNCICGRSLGHDLHVQAAPGVDVPERVRDESVRAAARRSPWQRH